MSCLAHQENTLCPREEKEGKRGLFPRGTERVFSALVQTTKQAGLTPLDQ